MISLWQAHLSFAMIIFLLLPSFGLSRNWRIALLLAGRLVVGRVFAQLH
jgi:hypothetical protein